jgi:8-oxo-dGTP diphosphatase
MTKSIHAAGVIFENEHGQILVLRRHPQDPEGTTWGLPGGKVELDETEAATVKREVQEEIGHELTIEELQFVKSYHWEREDLDIHFAVFTLPTQTEKVTIAIDANEHTEHLWASPKDLYARKDLMIGLYPILKDKYDLE